MSKIVLFLTVLLLGVVGAEDISTSKNSLKLNKNGVEVFSTKLIQIIQMSIDEIKIYGKSKANKDDLTKSSMVLGMMLKQGQIIAEVSDTPTKGSKRKFKLYDNKIDKNVCIVYDSDNEYLYIKVFPNGRVCKSIAKVIKPDKYKL